MKRAVTLVLLVSFLSGCSAIPKARLASAPQVEEADAIGKIYVGNFTDLRKGGNVDTTILGTVRSGFGSPVKRIRDDRGADEFVREQIINAARSEGIIADRKPDRLIARREGGKWVFENNEGDKRPVLIGVINGLQVETMMNRGATINISVELLNQRTGKVVWKSSLVKGERAGTSGGIFDSTEDLKSWLAKCIEDAALELFKDPAFRKIIKA